MYTTDTWIKCPWLRMVVCTTYAGAHPSGDTPQIWTYLKNMGMDQVCPGF